LAYASRQSNYILGSIGAAIQVLAEWWNTYYGPLFGSVDARWNPAYITFYAGAVIVALAVWRGLRVPRAQPIASTFPIRFVNLAGLKLAGVGTIIEIIAVIWQEIVHGAFLPDHGIAPLALLTVGILTVNLGMVIGLTIEYGMVRHRVLAASTLKRTLMLVCVVVTFASIWLAAAGAFIYVARGSQSPTLTWITAVLLAMVASLVLASSKRVLPRIGGALSIGITFNIVSYFFLVVYAKFPAYVPWGLLPFALFDVLVLALNRVLNIARAVLVSSTVIGLLFWATYYPFTLYLFPWSSSLQLPLLGVILGGIAGAILGNAVYARLSSVVLGDVSA
jgi:hypothetical protein